MGRGVIAGADLVTTEVWRWRGLVTSYMVFVMDLASRRVHILGSTPYPGDVVMGQIVRLATAADDGVLSGHPVWICDRDRKWSGAVRQRFGDAGIRVVLTPARAPNANAHAERFVRSITDECLGRIIPLGERHVRGAITECVEHYPRERNHPGLDTRLIAGTPATDVAGRVRRRSRLGGLLNYRGTAGAQPHPRRHPLSVRLRREPGGVREGRRVHRGTLHAPALALGRIRAIGNEVADDRRPHSAGVTAPRCPHGGRAARLLNLSGRRLRQLR